MQESKTFVCAECGFEAPYTIHGRSLELPRPKEVLPPEARHGAGSRPGSRSHAPGSKQHESRSGSRQHESSSVAVKTVFLEDGYLLPDPNSSSSSRPLFLGSNCSQCDRMVCAGDACSFFYAKRFCKPCARKHMKAFPLQCLQLVPKIFNVDGKELPS